jgi:citrate lyase subunit beta / citryl-CoA lyase
VSSTDRPAPLRRSVFFVPGSEPRKLEKARGLPADTLLLDLEDAVAPAEKDRARELVAEFLRAAPSGAAGGPELAVRVNPTTTPYFEADLEAAVAAGAAAIVLPKAESEEQLALVAARLDALERRHSRQERDAVRLLPLVETARGIAGIAALALRAPQRIDALCFGHADFSRDMGLPTADANSPVVLHARCALVVAARAGGRGAIDTISLDVRDADVVRRETEQGLALGFEGKLCIHPMQVEIANSVYTPSCEQIGFARRVLDAAASAGAEGRGVFTVDGKMVDAPLIASQQRVLERARRAGAID